jgi:Fe-S-cluster containining protein
MFAKLLHLYQFVDQTMAMLFEKFPDEVRCGKGCTDCCNAVFDLSYIEAANLLTLFRHLEPNTQNEILDRCRTAEQQWQKIFTGQGDPSTARIRCPLLGDQGLCHCYAARPINCRTYGVPTVINGAAHVCGLSNFSKGKSYPTVDLAPLQKSLYEYSVESAGEKLGRQRWPVAAILLHPEQLTPK